MAETPAIEKTGKRAEPLHELRVRLPVDLHRQLLSLKVLRGKSLGESISSALGDYFAERERSRDPERAEA